MSRAERLRRLRLVAVRFPDVRAVERLNRAARKAGIARHRFILEAIEGAVAAQLARSRRKEAKNFEYDYVFHKIRVRQKWKGVDPREGKLNPEGRSIGNVVRIPAYKPPPIKKMNYHVAAFPDELVQSFLHAYSDPGEVVVDPFVGSGTTLNVAKTLGRKGVGYDTSTDFRETIASRIQER